MSYKETMSRRVVDCDCQPVIVMDDGYKVLYPDIDYPRRRRMRKHE